MVTVMIRIKGRLNESWAEWFEGLELACTDDETVLTGHLPDQAALYGLIAKLRDLGAVLTAVTMNEEPLGKNDPQIP